MTNQKVLKSFLYDRGEQNVKSQVELGDKIKPNFIHIAITDWGGRSAPPTR